MKQYKKVALAYSGGLDTSIIIPWLKENCGCEVVAVCADVGQGKELLGLEEKAIKPGACKVYIEDLTEEFITDFIYPTMQAGAEYEGKYLLGTSFARPLIAKRLAEIARQEGCDAISHGATGKGNDQVRFELTIKALAPELDIIAPWRVWDLKSREEEIAYAEARGIPVPVTRENNYSMDANIWHLSHEGSDLEDPWNEPKDELLMICKAPQDAPDEPCYFELSFDRGVPVAIDGETLSPIGMIARLNDLGAENGVGIDDMVENRLVGMKSRGVYENPGGRILYTAHAALETIALDKAVMHYKAIVSHEYADLVYNGMWYSPLREALAAFVAETQKTVTGTARMKLYKGNCICVGVKSPYSLYSEEIATFGESDYDHFDANGFINLFGLPLKVRAMALKDKRL